jgi:hypothetical protein
MLHLIERLSLRTVSNVRHFASPSKRKAHRQLFVAWFLFRCAWVERGERVNHDAIVDWALARISLRLVEVQASSVCAVGPSPTAPSMLHWVSRSNPVWDGGWEGRPSRDGVVVSLPPILLVILGRQSDERGLLQRLDALHGKDTTAHLRVPGQRRELGAPHVEPLQLLLLELHARGLGHERRLAHGRMTKHDGTVRHEALRPHCVDPVWKVGEHGANGLGR